MPLRLMAVTNWFWLVKNNNRPRRSSAKARLMAMGLPLRVGRKRWFQSGLSRPQISGCSRAC